MTDMRPGTLGDADVRQFFSIGDVCALTDLKPHVLRYWESQFKFLNPAKNRSGNRVYQRREVELILLVKHLLYTEKYTIDGARRQIDDHRRSGDLRAAARAALDQQTLDTMESTLVDIVAILTGAATAPSAADDLEIESGVADRHVQDGA